MCSFSTYVQYIYMRMDHLVGIGLQRIAQIPIQLSIPLYTCKQISITSSDSTQLSIPQIYSTLISCTDPRKCSFYHANPLSLHYGLTRIP